MLRIIEWQCLNCLLSQSNEKRQFQIHLISSNGPIDVMMISKKSENAEPSVVSIPPKEPYNTVATTPAVIASNENTDPQRTNSGPKEVCFYCVVVIVLCF